MDLETHIRERLAALKAERQRRAVELAQYDAVIAELEALLEPAPEPEIISGLPPAPAVDEPVAPELDGLARALGKRDEPEAAPHG